MSDAKSSRDPEPATRWWDDIDLGWILFMLVIPLTAYGCESARQIEVRNTAYQNCAAAKEASETCKIILQPVK